MKTLIATRVYTRCKMVSLFLLLCAFLHPAAAAVQCSGRQVVLSTGEVICEEEPVHVHDPATEAVAVPLFAVFVLIFSVVYIMGATAGEPKPKSAKKPEGAECVEKNTL